MATKDIGFMERLTGGSGDEAAQARLERMKMLAQGGSAAAVAHGMAARGAVGAGLGALSAGLNKETRNKDGILQGAKAGMMQYNDQMIGDFAGISANEVKSRREMRSDLGKLAQDGTFTSRHNMAVRAAQIASLNGDSQGLARALQTLDSIRADEAELSKLDAQATASLAKARKDGIMTGYTTKDGSPVSGQLHYDPDSRLNGLITYDPQSGQPKFIPFSANFTLHNPHKGSGKGRDVASQLRDIITPSDRRKMHERIGGAMATVRRTDRVLSSLWDAANDPNMSAEAMIGPAGRLATGISNFLIAGKSILETAGGVFGDNTIQAGHMRDKATGNYGRWSAMAQAGEGVLSWTEKAADGGEPITRTANIADLFEVPENLRNIAGAAQQYRAAIMEMAYMAARLAEPSNRGLSDKDIEAALVRIAGGTSDPAVMVRRFLEMQLDAAHEIDFSMSLYHGALGPEVSNDQIDKALAGEGYLKYKEAKDKLFSDYGVVGTEGSRVILGGPQLSETLNNPAGGRAAAVAQQNVTYEQFKELPNNYKLDVWAGRMSREEAIVKFNEEQAAAAAEAAQQ